VAELKLGGYQGSLLDLATHLRRRRLDPLTISATELVRQLRSGWRTPRVPSLDMVADELPVAAWVVRRKGLRLIPGSADDPEPDESPPDPPWAALPALTEWLRQQYGANHTWGGPARWPDPLPPEIPDATPWRLRWAWPPGRAPRPTPPPAVVVRTHPLWRRGLYVVHWLRRRPGGGTFQELARARPRPEQVDMLLVILALWARRRIAVGQDAPYGPLRVQLAAAAHGEGDGHGDG
jgi:chromatin segregation and condensation protein Rec8/ScpA/Scc1 (kleisin family)